MDDVRAVDWLPLEDAVERLSRAYERAFLANVGVRSRCGLAPATRPEIRRLGDPGAGQAGRDPEKPPNRAAAVRCAAAG